MAESHGTAEPHGTPVTPATRDRRTERTWRGDWQISVVIAVLILGLAGGLYLIHSHHRRNISLPSTLLGLRQVTSPQAQQWAHNAVAAERAASQGFLGAPVAAVYSDSAAGGFAVVVGTPCPNGPCLAQTTRQLVQSARANGHPDATAFPPGPPGGNLICYSDAVNGGKAFDCSWVDQVTAAEVFFNGGYATTLADAAAKTRKLRDAIER